MSAPHFPERSYNALLRTTPAQFREVYGPDVRNLFRDLYREAWKIEGRFAAVRIWLSSMIKLLVCAFAEHREEIKRYRSQRKQLPSRRSGYRGEPQPPRGPKNQIDSLLQDIRYAHRSFLRKPGLTVAAVLILGTGMGAATSIYSVVDTVMLRPLPYPNPAELVSLGYGGTRPRHFRLWQENLTSFGTLAASWAYPVDLTGDGPPENLRAAFVSQDLLTTLGATAHLGRLPSSDDYIEDAPVAVLSCGVWQRRWGGDQAVLGRQIQLDGRAFTVVGILDAGFVPPEAITGSRVDVWLPLDVEREEIQGWNILSVVARLNNDVGWIAAKSELDAFTRHIADEMPEEFVRQDGSIRYTGILPLQVATFRSVAGPLVMLAGAVLGMLLISCANVANLLLAHGTSRTREFALRSALGAGSGRIVRQLLTESVCLSVLGGLLGIGLSFLGTAAILRFSPTGVPRLENLAVDLRILVIALLASICTGILFGMFPALEAKRQNVGDALKEGSLSTTATRGGRRTRNGLVVAEIAIALVLLTGAGLFLRSLAAMGKVEPGFDSEQLVTVPLRLGSSFSEADRRQFFADVSERLEAMPGTEAVAAGITVPFQFVGASQCCIWHDVRGPAEDVEPLPLVMTHTVTPDYFRALHASITHGREFGSAEDIGDGSVVVVNEPTAQYFFGSADAIGRTLSIGGWGSFTVVGVVRPVHHWGFARGIQYGVYVPYARWGAFTDRLHLLVRSGMEIGQLSTRIKEMIRAVNPNVPVEEIVPMSERVATALAGQRFLSILLGCFAGLALVVASGGLYSSMLYMVGRRRQEMGIRLALGASGSRVVKLVLGSGLTITGIGIAVGIVGSIATARVFRRMIWGIPAHDPLTLTTVSLILALVALGASLIPAARAAREDPLRTLKAE